MMTDSTMPKKTTTLIKQKKRGIIVMDMKLEILFVPVSEVERAKLFYQKLGFRLDLDVAKEDFRAIQFTPPGLKASIILGKGITSAQPGSVDHTVLVVDDIKVARDDLIARGVDIDSKIENIT